MLTRKEISFRSAMWPSSNNSNYGIHYLVYIDYMTANGLNFKQDDAVFSLLFKSCIKNYIILHVMPGPVYDIKEYKYFL